MADEYLLYCKNMAIMSEKVYNDFLYSLSCFYEDGEEEGKPQSGFMAMIQKFINMLKDLINKAKDAISRLFMANGHVDMDAYMNSAVGKGQLQYDVDGASKEVEKQLTAGDKLIRSISSGTKVPEETVSTFVNSCAGAIKKFAVPVGISVASMMAYKKWFSRHTNEGRIQEYEKDMAKARVAAGIAEPEKMSMGKIFKAMSNMYSEASTVLYLTGKQIKEAATSKKGGK